MQWNPRQNMQDRFDGISCSLTIHTIKALKQTEGGNYFFQAAQRIQSRSGMENIWIFVANRKNMQDFRLKPSGKSKLLDTLPSEALEWPAGGKMWFFTEGVPKKQAIFGQNSGL